MIAKVSLNENRASHLCLKAQLLYNCGKFKEALESCDLAFEADASNIDNLLLLSTIHFEKKSFEESEFYCKLLLEVDPNCAEAYSNYGNAVRELRQHDFAMELYQKATKLKPKFADAYNNLANVYLEKGLLKEAMETYKMAIILNPNLSEAHTNIGNILRIGGDIEGAKNSYLEAVRIQQDSALAWNNLGKLYHEAEQYQTALMYYKEGLKHSPNCLDLHNNLGITLRDMSNFDDAIKSFEVALAIDPKNAITMCNLGATLYDKGDINQAVVVLKQALLIRPNFPEGLCNLGTALRLAGRLDEATGYFRTAMQIQPSLVKAHMNLGITLRDKGYIPEAIHCFVTAVRLRPKCHIAHSNLGTLFREAGRIDEAKAHYLEAIKLNPIYSDAYSNLGSIYRDLRQHDDSEKCFQSAIKIRPDFAEAYANLAAVYEDKNQTTKAIHHYEHALQIKPDFHHASVDLAMASISICCWKNYYSDMALLLSLANTQIETVPHSDSFIPLHEALLCPFNSRQLLGLAKCHTWWIQASKALEERRIIHRPREKTARLKIGYISSAFGNTETTYLMQSVFKLHDKKNFEVTCYSLNPSDRSSLRRIVEMTVEHFSDISGKQSASQIASLISKDGINILIDLDGYKYGGRVDAMALRPAVIQVHFLGFPGTMGADYYDYIIADDIVIPDENKQYFQEHVVSLPNSYWVNSHRQSAVDMGTTESVRVNNTKNELARTELGLPKDKIIMCYFGSEGKLDPETYSIWMRILAKTANTVLWLISSSSDTSANIYAEAEKRRIGADRIVVTDQASSREERLRRGKLADLFLDVPICNARTAMCDMLWVGTPALTIKGSTMASRSSASMLIASGLSELVCETAEQYEKLIEDLVTDTNRLESIRIHLIKTRNTNPLFDTSRWVKNFEKSLMEMWHLYSESQHPQHIKISEDCELDTS